MEFGSVFSLDGAVTQPKKAGGSRVTGEAQEVYLMNGASSFSDRNVKKPGWSQGHRSPA
jgi:hypothetical protein